jgi:hypothetical protein
MQESKYRCIFFEYVKACIYSILKHEVRFLIFSFISLSVALRLNIRAGQMKIWNWEEGRRLYFVQVQAHMNISTGYKRVPSLVEQAMNWNLETL